MPAFKRSGEKRSGLHCYLPAGVVATGRSVCSGFGGDSKYACSDAARCSLFLSDPSYKGAGI